MILDVIKSCQGKWVLPFDGANVNRFYLITGKISYLSAVKRRLYLILLCAGWLISPLNGQTLAEQLLAQLAGSRPDTQRVRLLTDYAWEINETDPHLAEQKLWEAVALARQLNDITGEGAAWNGLGIVEEIKGNWAKAREYYLLALQFREKSGDRKSIAATYNNLGTLAENTGKYYDAIDFHSKNLQILEDLNDTVRIARAHYNLAGVYESLGVYLEATEHLNRARFILEYRDDKASLAKVYNLLGHTRFELEIWNQAHQWYAQALHLYEQLGDSSGIANAYLNLANNYDEWGNNNEQKDSIDLAMRYYERALHLFSALDDSLSMAAVYNNMGVACKHLKEYDRGLEYLALSMSIRRRYEHTAGIMEAFNSYGDIYFGKKQYAKALDFTEKYYRLALELHDEKFTQKGLKDFSKIYAATGDFQKAYQYRVQYDEMRYKRLDENRAHEFNRREALYADRQKEVALARQKAEIAQKEAELARSTATRNGLIGGAVALLLLAALFYNRARLRARSNRQLAVKNAAIDRERRRADELLMNILPESAAAELKAHNSVRPVRYESVSVMFTDFKSFTRIAEKVPPEELIAELDECFRLFDAIVEQFGLEKIKTIGDAYMCAGGLPEINNTHPENTVRAAIEMQRQLAQLMRQKAVEGKPAFEMRIGIHTGPVVAGVVGSRKFAYDIWGDTVNVAARIEQNSEPNKINISGATYELVRHLFTCEYRGEIEAKNKGAIKMYFVEIPAQ